MIIGTILLLAGLSGWLYHLGGINHLKRPNFPILRQKPRDMGCAILVLVCMLLLGFKFNPATWYDWIIWLLCFGITWGSTSTYFDTVFFNPIKPKDNFWMHGWFIGISLFPYCILYGEWVTLVLRGLLCAVFMGLWSLYTPPLFDIEEARVEEFGRGLIIPLSMLLFLIGG